MDQPTQGLVAGWRAGGRTRCTTDRPLGKVQVIQVKCLSACHVWWLAYTGILQLLAGLCSLDEVAAAAMWRRWPLGLSAPLPMTGVQPS